MKKVVGKIENTVVMTTMSKNTTTSPSMERCPPLSALCDKYANCCRGRRTEPPVFRRGRVIAMFNFTVMSTSFSQRGCLCQNPLIIENLSGLLTSPTVRNIVYLSGLVNGQVILKEKPENFNSE